LFEQTNAGYGEVWFDVGGRKATTRAITEDAVLGTIYTLAEATPLASEEDGIFRGHPLATEPRGAALIFYVLWPVLIVVMSVLGRVPSSYRGFRL
jgi:hypothetical protein